MNSILTLVHIIVIVAVFYIVLRNLHKRRRI